MASKASRAALIRHNERSKEMGLSPKGLPLAGDRKTYMENYRKQYRVVDEERVKQQNREAQQKRRKTLIGKMSNRLRVAVRKYLQGKGGFSQLPFTPAELQAHIQAKLEERQYLCPMCGASLEERFDIDHRIPLSSAKTVDEVITLFALSNLDVLCPPCNQHKKGKKHIVY
jgi:5-methylcytosine-specific restriction endonuclease McrA